MHTSEVVSALDVAAEIAHNLPQSTSQIARELYRVLVEVAVERTARLGRSAKTTEATMHLPVELVAAAAGVSRVTAWRYLPELRALGLIDNRPHKAACRGETRNSGTCWAVRLSPLQGKAARLSADDMRHKWRDMDGDLRRGRTSQKMLKRTRSLQDRSLKIMLLVDWTLPPTPLIEPDMPVRFSTSRPSLEAVLDVTGAAREDRGPAVDLAAQALSQALRDRGGLMFYRRMLWQLLRRYDATTEDMSYRVYLAAQRACTDATEGFARKPGALFVSRLKAAPWFDEMMHGPPIRVGLRPR